MLELHKEHLKEITVTRNYIVSPYEFRGMNIEYFFENYYIPYQKKKMKRKSDEIIDEIDDLMDLVKTHLLYLVLCGCSQEYDDLPNNIEELTINEIIEKIKCYSDILVQK